MLKQELLQQAREEFVAKKHQTPEECGYHETYIVDNDFILFAESTKEVEAFKTYRKILLSILKGFPIAIAFLVLSFGFGVFYILPNYGSNAEFLLYLLGLAVLFTITILVIQYFLKKSRKFQTIFEGKIYTLILN